MANFTSILSKLINSAAFLAIAYASYLLILLSLPYIYFEPNVEFLGTKQWIYHIDLWRISFYVHVFSSPIVIIAGLFQFNKWMIRNRPKWHKALGYTYVVTVLLISGPAALVMSFYANGGRVAQTSFVLLSFCWIIFTFISFWKVKKGNFLAHIKWNIRSYALTLSAVTLRFYAYLFDVFEVQLGPKETYILLAYLSWIPNLILAELLIAFGYARHLLKSTVNNY
ncbi:MAG: DUF2306 domain-containing protein [Flavobacteriales bacterium]|nr:DUF2306 domain-containing protein [Flavobacteriales bacterium]